MTDVFQPMLTGTRLIATRDEATFKTAPTTGTLYLHNGMTGYSGDGGNRHKNFSGQGQMYYTVSALLDLMGQATHAMPTVFYELLIADMNRLFGTDPVLYSKVSSGGTDTYTWRLPRYGIRKQVPSFTLYEGEPAYCLRRTGGFLTAWNIASERSGDVTGGQSSTYATVLDETAFPGTGTEDTFTVTLTGSPDGGNFTLTGYNPDSGAVWVSSAIAWNATAAQIATAITDSVNVPAGAVVAGTVPGGPLPTLATVKAAGAWAGQAIPTPTLGTNSLTGGTTPGVTIGAGVTGALPTTPALTPTGITPLVPGLVQHSYGAYGTAGSLLDTPDGATSWLLNATGGTVIEASSFDFTNVAGPGYSEETSQSFAYFKDMLDQNNGRADNIRLNLTFDDAQNDVLRALKEANLAYIDPSSASLCAAASPAWHQWRCGPCGIYDLKLRIYGAAADPLGRDDRGGNYVRSIAIGPHVNPSTSDAAGSPVECILKVPTPA